MPDSVAELVRRGRALPPDEREQLVDQLLETLNEPAARELDAAWSAEVEKRLAEYDSGAVTAIDAEELFAIADLIGIAKRSYALPEPDCTIAFSSACTRFT